MSSSPSSPLFPPEIVAEIYGLLHPPPFVKERESCKMPRAELRSHSMERGGGVGVEGRAHEMKCRDGGGGGEVRMGGAEQSRGTANSNQV